MDTGPDPDEVKKRMKAITRLKNKLNKLTQSDGGKNEKTIKISQNLSEKIMELKLSPKLMELLINELKSDIKTIRTQERNVMQMAVVKAGMPRKDFISSFGKSQTDLTWIEKHIRAKRKHSSTLSKLKNDILRAQKN